MNQYENLILCKYCHQIIPNEYLAIHSRQCFQDNTLSLRINESIYNNDLIKDAVVFNINSIDDYECKKNNELLLCNNCNEPIEVSKFQNHTSNCQKMYLECKSCKKEFNQAKEYDEHILKCYLLNEMIIEQLDSQDIYKQEEGQKNIEHDKKIKEIEKQVLQKILEEQKKVEEQEEKSCPYCECKMKAIELYSHLVECNQKFNISEKEPNALADQDHKRNLSPKFESQNNYSNNNPQNIGESYEDLVQLDLNVVIPLDEKYIKQLPEEKVNTIFINTLKRVKSVFHLQGTIKTGRDLYSSAMFPFLSQRRNT